MINNRKQILKLSYAISKELRLAGNPFHDVLGRFSSKVSGKVTNLVKKKPSSKHLKDAAKALGEAADDYTLMNYGFNVHTLAASVSTLKHHIHKVRKIKPKHIKELSNRIVSKMQRKNK